MCLIVCCDLDNWDVYNASVIKLARLITTTFTDIRVFLCTTLLVIRSYNELRTVMTNRQIFLTQMLITLLNSIVSKLLGNVNNLNYMMSITYYINTDINKHYLWIMLCSQLLNTDDFNLNVLTNNRDVIAIVSDGEYRYTYLWCHMILTMFCTWSEYSSLCLTIIFYRLSCFKYSNGNTISAMGIPSTAMFYLILGVIDFIVCAM